MTTISHIDVKTSIEKGKLVGKRNWLEYFDSLVFCMLCLGFIICPTLIIYGADLSSSNEKAFAFIIMPLAIVFGVYSIYRKLSEKLLVQIETVFGKAQNKEILIKFLKQRGWTIQHQNKDVIIVYSQEEVSFNNLWTKTTTFIVSDQAIFFNMVKNYPKLSPPVLFSHLFLKKDLKRYIHQLM